MKQLAGFPDWYRAKLGHQPLLIQGALWFFYGFIWIPLWYLSARNDHMDMDAATGSEKGLSASSTQFAGFSDWYKTKLGHQPLLIQGALWFFYGFIWIPLWYLGTKNDGVNTNAATGSVESLLASPMQPVIPATDPAPPRRIEPVWPPITLEDRLLALLAVKPVALEVVEQSDTPSAETEAIRVLHWNYARLFAFAWAGLSLTISSWNAPLPGGPTTLDMFFTMAGLLYVVFAGLQAFHSGGYWRSFFVVSEFSSLPFNKLRLLVTCAAEGLLQFVLAAFLVGVVIGVGAAMR